MRKLALIALLASVAVPAAAQPVEPWRSPGDHAPAVPAPVTSSEDAAKPSPAEQHQAKTLAVAVFAKPAAAQRAADKVTAAAGPAIPPAEPKPEWVAKDGVGIGSKGVEVKTPF